MQPIYDACKRLGVEVSLSEGWEKGSDGTVDLAEKVMEAVNKKPTDTHKFLYDNNTSIKEKIESLAAYYGADGVDYSETADKSIEDLEKIGRGHLPVCMAKTQYSLSDNPKLLGRPKGFRINVRKVKISNGAGFIVVLTGSILRMPGLPRIPSASEIDIDNNGNIIGLF